MSPQLSVDLRKTLAAALSGFSNTEGGIIIWGMATKRHGHSGLDVLTQIEPIGHCAQFARQAETTIPSLTTPSITKSTTKCLFEKKRDKKGVVITFIPKVIGDPVQVVSDTTFYFRSGAEFVKAPYEMVKRLFAATESPELTPTITFGENKPNGEGFLELPITLSNGSSAVARFITVSLEIINPDFAGNFSLSEFQDVSDINPGKKIFVLKANEDVIHRGLNAHIGRLRFRKPERDGKLSLDVKIFADKMRARAVRFELTYAQDSFSMILETPSFVY